MTAFKPYIAKLASALLLAFIPAFLHAKQKIFFANDYGAKGDGIHFDGVAIQEAIHVAAKNGNTLTFKPQDTRPEPEGYSIYGWPRALREQYLEKWHADHPIPAALGSKLEEQGESYETPAGYSDTADHQANFYNAVRTRKPVVENEVFGNHTAIGCHLANFSYFNNDVAVWDPANKTIVKG